MNCGSHGNNGRFTSFGTISVLPNLIDMTIGNGKFY